MCWPVLDLFAAVFVVATVFFSFFLFFFSLPLIITLVAAYFLTAPLENCHVLLPTKYIIPLRLLSLAQALCSVIKVNVDIKTHLVEEKTRICCCCCFFPLKVRVAMRFTSKTGARVLEMRKFTLAYMKRSGRTNGVRTILLEPKFLGCIDNSSCREPIFLPMVLHYTVNQKDLF